MKSKRITLAELRACRGMIAEQRKAVHGRALETGSVTLWSHHERLVAWHVRVQAEIERREARRGGNGHSKRVRDLVTEYQDWATDSGISLVLADGSDRGRVAVHLLEPTRDELERGIWQAERDNFSAVVIHTARTWPGGEVARG